MAARMAMMAITTRSSIKVKPADPLRFIADLHARLWVHAPGTSGRKPPAAVSRAFLRQHGGFLRGLRACASAHRFGALEGGSTCQAEGLATAFSPCHLSTDRGGRLRLSGWARTASERRSMAPADPRRSQGR